VGNTNAEREKIESTSFTYLCTMKKNLVYLVFIAVAIGMYFYFRPPVNFEKDTINGIQFYRNSFAETMTLAKQQNKPIFLDIYATWCGPCKRMKKYVFTNTELGTYFNNHFINLSLNAEASEGNTLCRKYGIESYPTMCFINPDGSLIKKISNYTNKTDLLKAATLLLLK
jgi:thioredoxin 1